MNKILSNLPMNEMLAVVQLGYQLIASAKQAPLSEEDDPSIDYIIEKIGFGDNEMMGNYIWNEGSDVNKTNPFTSFTTVAKFSSEKNRHSNLSLMDFVPLNYLVLQLSGF